MKTVTVYGIKNCNTVKKALKWLEEHKIEYLFHDYKRDGISEDRIKIWQKRFGWEPLVNKSGTTWRKLPEALQALVTDATSARELMIEKSSVIKRPIIEYGATIVLGFDEENYKKLLS